MIAVAGIAIGTGAIVLALYVAMRVALTDRHWR